MPPLALTLGDPAGIGPELALSAWLGRGGISEGEGEGRHGRSIAPARRGRILGGSDQAAGSRRPTRRTGAPPVPVPQRIEAMPSAVVAVPTFWRRSASPRVFSSTRSSTVWLRSRTPVAVAIGELM